MNIEQETLDFIILLDRFADSYYFARLAEQEDYLTDEQFEAFQRDMQEDKDEVVRAYVASLRNHKE